MERTVITIGLSNKSFRDAQKAVRKYKRELLKKCRLFVDKLAEVGIETATQAVSSDSGNPPEENKGYGRFVVFRKQIENANQLGVRGILIASNSAGLLRSQWRTLNTASGVATADVSPILMAEFGAGLKANNPRASEFGMGQGTFPGQTHAFDADGWWYQTLDYEWHHSYGVTPTMPVQKAADEMVREIGKVAREVWT